MASASIFISSSDSGMYCHVCEVQHHGLPKLTRNGSHSGPCPEPSMTQFAIGISGEEEAPDFNTWRERVMQVADIQANEMVMMEEADQFCR